MILYSVAFLALCISGIYVQYKSNKEKVEEQNNDRVNYRRF